MPIYEYECLVCGKLHEIIQRHNDMPPTECPSCGGEIRKLISQSSFVLKGTGWYKTDYAQTDKNKPQPKEKAGTTAEKPESKSESKPETTPAGSAKT